MSEARIDRISNENSTAGPIISGITTFSGQNYFVPPKGTTAERPSNCPVGSIRFNTDSAKLEYFDSLQWLEMEAFNVEIGISTAAAPASSGTGHRGLFAGGDNPSDQSRIDYITISTLGNTISFGNLTDARTTLSACASSTRGLFCGGYFPTEGIIDFVTISSTGNATSFGNLTQHRIFSTSLSSSTRGITAGGRTSPSPAESQFNIIDYVTIASTGNSVDFGDLFQARNGAASFASTTRGVFGGGYNPGPTQLNTIDYITIATLGNAVDFGDLTEISATLSGCSNATRGLFGGGRKSSANVNTISYITIQSTGNAIDFGDLTVERRGISSCSSPTRGVFGHGSASLRTNTIDYVTIMTTGNAQDFGDLNTSSPPSAGAACSNGHGGL